MKTISVKLAPEVAEALTRMGALASRSRAAELDFIVRARWNKQMNGAPLPVPQGELIRVNASPTSTIAMEHQAWIRARKDILQEAADYAATIESFERKAMELSATRRVKWRDLSEGERDWFKATKETNR